MDSVLLSWATLTSPHPVKQQSLSEQSQMQFSQTQMSPKQMQSEQMPWSQTQTQLFEADMGVAGEASGPPEKANAVATQNKTALQPKIN